MALPYLKGVDILGFFFEENQQKKEELTCKREGFYGLTRGAREPQVSFRFRCGISSFPSAIARPSVNQLDVEKIDFVSRHTCSEMKERKRERKAWN